MFKSIHILYFSLLLVVNFSFAQSLSIDEMKKTPGYLWGYAESPNLPEADKLAMEDLISQISVQVESEFENILEEKRDGDDRTLDEYTRSVVKTYSRASLQNCQRLVEEKKSVTRVLRYLKQEDITRIFADRKARIMDYTTNALRAENSLSIGDALRNYYYALVLLRSHPEMNAMRYAFPDSSNTALLIALPQRMDALLRGIEIQVKSINELPEQKRKDLLLSITYKGQPVQSLDYRYFNGFDYSVIESAANGMGVLELIGEQARSDEKIRLFIEYEYENMIGSDPELKNTKESTIPPPFFASSEKWLIVGKGENPKPETRNSGTLEQGTRNPGTLESYSATDDYYQTVVKQVVTGIRNKKYDELNKYFTPEGYGMLDTLIMMGNVRVLPLPDTLRVVSLHDETMVRSVPMRFSYQNNQRQFVENVVFLFDKEGKINAITFSLGDKAIADIVGQSERWGTTEEKYQLIRFMENYKTAYCMKRVDYIESIFANNALIIVGRVLKEAEPIDNLYLDLGTDNVQYVRYNKESYINHLRANFARNEFVNIHFEDNQVLRKSGEDKVYGIQIAQHYYSSTYADFGYLFLMIDLNDTLNPKIYVRTWQPQKNPDGSIFGLADFHF